MKLSPLLPAFYQLLIDLNLAKFQRIAIVVIVPTVAIVQLPPPGLCDNQN
jgi:hypothetical protein